jgi:hypothetical protein
MFGKMFLFFKTTKKQNQKQKKLKKLPKTTKKQPPFTSKTNIN